MKYQKFTNFNIVLSNLCNSENWYSCENWKNFYVLAKKLRTCSSRRIRTEAAKLRLRHRLIFLEIWIFWVLFTAFIRDNFFKCNPILIVHPWTRSITFCDEKRIPPIFSCLVEFSYTYASPRYISLKNFFFFIWTQRSFIKTFILSRNFHQNQFESKYTLLPKYRHLRKDSQSNWFCGHFMNCSTMRIAPYHEETILDYCS